MKNNSSVIVPVYSSKDINKINKKTKYINIDIFNPNYDVISYFVNTGDNYLYSDIFDNIKGYNYVKYEEFVKAENIIDMIYANMPSELNKIDIAKYLYVSLAKILSYDINANTEKNELFNLSLITNMNNIWGSIAIGRVNNLTCAKIYSYLCKRLDIDANIIKDDEIYKVKLKIDKIIIITDLYHDIPFINANMHTKYFGSYNNDIEQDKRIKYIKNKYNDDVLDKLLKNIDYMDEECIYQILSKTEKIICVDDLKPTELSVIYKDIFDKYCPNYDIKINNLYLNETNKKHFIMISYNNDHYSYNYKQKRFIKVKEIDIIENINTNKIGLYLNEYIPNISNKLEFIN